MLCNFLGCVKIVFEMNFVKNALLTMGNDTLTIPENGGRVKSWNF